MTAQQLKNSILQLAVQGKLVPQDPTDEPASVLLERIRAEKEKLIKEGKIKKEKNPSVIFRGADNTPYEKIGNSEPISIADEVPFDIPNSWEWVRFNNLVNYNMGKTPPRKEIEYWESATFPWVSIADLVGDGIVNTTKECVNDYAAKTTFKGKISKAGTLLMSFKLTVGKVSILGIDAFHNEAIISIYPFIDENKITTNYLFKVLPLISQSGDTKTAIKGNTLNSDSLDSLLIPLPPVNEQKRICDKIDALNSPLCFYEESENEARKLDMQFPEQLKKSILQMAVQGKLVPQDENDEPASVLLERIRAEKQRLIAEGKIKKDKNESVIFRRDNSHYEKFGNTEHCIDDEIPFEVPDSWGWVRISSISSVVTKGTTPRGGNVAYLDEGIGFLRAENVAGLDIIDKSNLSYIDEETHNGYLKRSILKENDILITIAGTLGRTGLVRDDDLPLNANQAVSIVRLIDINEVNLLYLIYALNSPIIQKALTTQKKITAIPNLTLEIISNCIIPMPPLSEQIRIVEAIKTIIPYCESL